MTWLIYKHTNTVSNKSYIGLTKYSVKRRWTQHTHAARSGSPFHFHNAIRLYGEDNWEHIILEDNIKTQREAELLEMAHILKYDTFENGYNSTIGGEGQHRKRNGEISTINYNRRPKGKMRKSIFRFIHKKHGELKCTKNELIEKFNLHRTSLNKVIRGARNHTKGWYIHPDDKSTTETKFLN